MNKPDPKQMTYCPCGSGMSVSDCNVFGGSCYAVENSVRIAHEREIALEFQRIKQQGHGRPIISCEMNGIRFVSVGEKLYQKRGWKTFHDFLFDFTKVFFNQEWREIQEEREAARQHPLVRLWNESKQAMAKIRHDNGGVARTVVNGSLGAFLDLSYSLFLVEHNCGIPPLVIKRLKQPEQFYPALYEIWVAASMIKAGFTITYEDESDETRTHCEFTAVFKDGGRSFSVEVKRRQMNDRAETVGRQLKKALGKRADFTRIIAIETNLPADQHEADLAETMRKTLSGLRQREIQSPLADSEPAYVIVTNSPYEHHPDVELKRWALVEGFKINDLKFGNAFSTVKEMVESRDRHREIYCLMQSFKDQRDFPATFDGEIPEFSFGAAHDRLLIGNRYVVPSDVGAEEVAELESAIVSKGKAFCIMRTLNQRRLIVSFEMSEDELAAYDSHPETYFGKIEHNRAANDPLGIYDQMIECYKQSPKEKLLEFMGNFPDVDELKGLPQSELAKIYAERITEGILGNALEK